MSRTTSSLRAFGLAALLTTATLPSLAHASGGEAEPSPAAATAPDQEGVKLVPIESLAPEPSQLIVVRDEETGELRAPTAKEAAALAPMVDPLNRSDAGLVEVHYPDGTIEVDLQGRFQSMTTTRNGAFGCTHDAGHVVEMMQTQASEPTRNEVPDVQ